jgi:cation diffusion facilitator family transporter
MTPGGITWGSFLLNVVLMNAKIVVGLLAHSQALVADGLHSASDFVTDIAVLTGLRMSKRPADPTHRYGHLRVNTLAALFVSGSLLGAAGLIVHNGILSLHNRLHGHEIKTVQADIPFWLAMCSVPLKEGMFRLTRYVGRKTANVSVIANAWHDRADAFASLAAAMGLGGVVLGGNKWQFLDAMTAIVLGAFVLVVALRIAASAANELIDRAPGAATLATIEKALSETAGVRSFHAFRARELGGKVEMDVHVQVDPELTVAAGHDIAWQVRQRVMQADERVVAVIVHVEPAGYGASS